ncbi:MAG: Gfo/Idh/MocA family oxidoreductase, partial [Actinobacteria bacterium]|nr:Gfo/Idh/MocA family oxidoreductase [Actinomycetota bacterium]
MRNLRWGVISTADIGMTKVIPAIQRADHCEVVAIASRDAGRATAAAARLGIPKAYGTYQELLDCEEVEAVYIPLPNDAHAEWTIRAAAA